MNRTIPFAMASILAGTLLVGAAVLRWSGPVAKKSGSIAAVAVPPREYALLEKKIADLEGELTRTREETAAHRRALAEKAPPVSPPAPDDWRKNRTPEFETKVQAIPWKKRIKSLVAYFREMDDARKAGRSLKMDMSLVGDLMSLNTEVSALSEALGQGKNSFKAYSNELVGEHFFDAYLEALAGSPVDPELTRRIRSASDRKLEGPSFDFGTLGEWRAKGESNLHLLVASRDLLTPEQHASLERTISASFLQSGFSTTLLKADSAEGLAGAVSSHWEKKLGLPESVRAAVEPIAVAFCREHQALRNEYRLQYGATLSKDREIELDNRLLDLQIAMEHRLVSLHLDDEAKKRVLKSSGSVIELRAGGGK